MASSLCTPIGLDSFFYGLKIEAIVLYESKVLRRNRRFQDHWRHVVDCHPGFLKFHRLTINGRLQRTNSS
jgi:hypothetical protein